MSAGTAGRRVLLAEDEAVIALDIGDALRRAGYEMVGPAATAGEAERLAREEPLDAAVLDIGLRDGTAVAVADALAGRGVAFVFLTGYAAETVPARFRGRPVLGKPVAVERLPAAREQRVRERAHAIWEREGRPGGQEERHWAEAEAELRAGEGPGRARDRGPPGP
jgi:DNA-binding response OmpR family regulator